MRIPKHLPSSQVQKPTHPLPPEKRRNVAAFFAFANHIMSVLGQILATGRTK